MESEERNKKVNMKERKGIEKRESKRSILEQLKTYSASDYYPFHMPGHKRNRVEGKGLAEKFPNPFPSILRRSADLMIFIIRKGCFLNP